MKIDDFKNALNLPATRENPSGQFPDLVSHPDSQAGKPKEQWKDLAFCSTTLARRLLTYKLARKYCVLPLAVLDEAQGKILTVIFAEPLNAHTLQEVKVAVGVDIIYETTSKEILEKAIFAAYAGGADTLSRAVERISHENQEETIEHQTQAPYESADVSDSAIPSLLTAIISRGIALGASDIHLEPKHGCYTQDGPLAGEYRIRFRVDGFLREDDSFRVSSSVASKLSRRVKVLAKLDITNSRLIQEGAITFTSPEWSVRIRLSLFPQVNGEKIVFRLLGNDQFDSNILKDAPFTHLGLSSEQERNLRTYLGLASGTILLSGPTGSGKSTLLYAAIQYLNTQWRNIVTIEDPVERLIAGVNQAEVCRETGLDYDQWLSPILRQDPDVIMVGEIRTKQTAQAVLTAGITGHLVLTTLHAGNCLEVLTRLIHFPVNLELILSSLRLVISQRLLPKNCTHCLRFTTANRFIQRLFRCSESQEVAVSQGCNHCSFSGMSGRVGVYEFLPITEMFRGSIYAALQDQSNEKKNHHELNFQQLAFAAEQVGYRSYAFGVRELLHTGTVSPLRAMQALGVNPELGEN